MIDKYTHTEKPENIKSNNQSNASKGEILYNQAMDKINEIQNIKKKINESKIIEQYNSIPNTGNDRRSSIAVIRTIIRQAREDVGKEEKTKKSKRNLMEQDELKEKSLSKKEYGERMELLKHESLDLFQQSALEYNYPDALIYLADLLLEESHESPIGSNDDNASLPMYTIQTDNKCPSMNNNNKNNIYKAAYYYELGGYHGSGWSYFLLGMLLWNGHTNKFPSNINMSLEAMKQAVKLNDANAMYFLGTYYIDSYTDMEKQMEGLDYVARAATLNHSEALYYLALYYYNGNDILDISKCSDGEYRDRLNKACDAGSPDALFTRGHAQLKGEDGYTQDPKLSLDDFLKARTQNHLDSIISAGAIYHHGIKDSNGDAYIPSNKQKAFELYQLAVDIDYDCFHAWRNIVDCYRNGDGVVRNLSMAEYIEKNILFRKDN